jgi:hypothetical protein
MQRLEIPPNSLMKFWLARRFCSTRTRLGAIPDVAPESVSHVSELQTTHGIGIGLPLEEDLKAGAISGTIRNQWSNVPAQVRKVLEESQSTSARSLILAYTGNSSEVRSIADKMLALVGRGPADLQVDRAGYCSSHSLVPYQKGTKAAFHWSKVLIPRTVAARCREDLRVDPIDADRSVLLLDLLLDKTTVIFCFSGNEFSGLNTGVKAWKKVLGSDQAQVLSIHMCEGWLSRRTHPLTRQILRSFKGEDIEPSRTDKVYIYRGKMNKDIVLDFHVYNKSLPSILLVDKRGYIRWHAVGLPTEESAITANNLLKKLIREKS